MLTLAKFSYVNMKTGYRGSVTGINWRLLCNFFGYDSYDLFAY